jgi:gluconate kinase
VLSASPRNYANGHDRRRDGCVGLRESTVGKLLARQLGGPSLKGTTITPPPTSRRCVGGFPLTTGTADLARRNQESPEKADRRHDNVVLACSASKHSYQHYLARFAPESVYYAYLARRADPPAARKRKGALYEGELAAPPVRNAGASRKRSSGGCNSFPGGCRGRDSRPAWAVTALHCFSKSGAPYALQTA